MRHAFSSRVGSALIALATAFATAAAPATFNYGGHLVQNGTPVSGTADFQFRLFTAPTGGTLVNANPPTVSTTLAGGDFSTPVDLTALGGLASIQDNSRVLQGGWVEVAVRRPGEQAFTPLLPRQQFSAVPGALYAESTAHAALADQVAPAAIGHAQIAPGSIQPDSLLAGTVVRSLNGLTDSVRIVAGTGVTLTSANGTITISSTGGSAGAAGWSLTGNAGVTDDQFLGTTDLHPLTLKVNGAQAVRYEFGQSTDFGNNPPNVIGGMANNVAGPGTYGSFIGAGSFITNGSFFSFIGGGSVLLLGTNSPWSAMVGGYNNLLGDNSNGSFMGGGLDLRIYNSTGAVLAGGTDNTITNSGGAFLGGGQNNLILPDVSGNSTLVAVITGGGHNTINGSSYASIGGGAYNTVDFGGYIGTIAGGQQNQITNAGWSTIAGGLGNKVVVSNGGAAIGGGAYNQVGLGNGTFFSAGYATVPGGYGNTAAGEYSFAAGLYAQATNNGTFVWSDSLASQFDRFGSVTANEFAVRARGGVRFETGGKGLTVDGISFNPGGNGFSLGDGAITAAKLAAPNPQPGQFLALDGNGALQWVAAPGGGGGPAGNAWQLGGNAGTTTGQFLGTTDAQPLELRAGGQTGLRLSAAANASGETGINVVSGFGGNSVASGATGATIGGGGFKEANGVVHPNKALGSYATVAGGFDNLGGDVGTVVGGGSRNRTTDQYATVAGGLQNSAVGNSATVAGGFNNQAGSAKGLFAAVGGGANNTASGQFATIPGGSLNQATGVSSFAAGHRALATHDGSFVWADGTEANFGSTTPNEFAVRARGGVRIDTGGKGLTVDGALITAGGANPVTSVNVSAAGAGKNAVEAHAKVGAIAIHGISDDAAANTYAAQFDGNVNVTGTLNVNGNIIASRIQLLGNLQVNDVAAQTVSARGLVGNPGTPDGTALSVKSGGIQVLGAGDGTPTAVYRHRESSISPSQIDRKTTVVPVETTSLGVILDHPMLNGHPEVFVLFSENATHYGGIDQLAYMAVYRDDLGRWTITHHGNQSGVRGHYDTSVWAIMIIKP